MARRKKRDRINFDAGILDMPLITHLGFDHLLEPIGLRPHSHENPELTYVAEGEVCWVLENGSQLQLTGGHTAIIQPNVVHSGKWNIISPSILFWIVLNPTAPLATSNTSLKPENLEQVAEMLRSCGNVVRPGNEILQQLYKRLIDAMLQYEDQNDDLILFWMRSILTQIVVLSAQLFQLPDNTGGQALSDLTELFEFMQHHVHDNLSVNDFAEFYGMSVARFNGFFKRETGMTPADYFRRLKCEKARQYLMEPKQSITDTAFRLGFSSSQHFASVFRKYFGVSPSRYRQKLKFNR